MEGRERVGVVVPTLNEAQGLPRLLARLSPAPGRDPQDTADEVVVVDGGSSDRTCELARASGARVLSAARGRGQQMAAGASALRTEWLFFVHADCVPAPGALSALRRACGAGEHAWAACSQHIEAEGRFYRLVETAADRRVRRQGMVFGDSGLFVQRDFYESVGGFRTLPLFEDVDLSRRLRRRSRPLLVPGAGLRVSPRRWQEEGALRATLRNWMIRTAFVAGVSAECLTRFYAPRTASGRTS